MKKDYTKNIIKKILSREAEQRLIYENSRYGKFIIQTNEVQFYLVWLIVMRSFPANDGLIKNLEELTLGQLVGYFRVKIKGIDELKLENSLKTYNGKRIALAHKMFTDKKLIPKECESSIDLGEKLIEELKELIEKRNSELGIK